MNGSRGGVSEGAPDKPSVAVGTDASSGQRPQLVCAWTESAIASCVPQQSISLGAACELEWRVSRECEMGVATGGTHSNQEQTWHTCKDIYRDLPAI